jgi:hypothetical protein
MSKDLLREAIADAKAVRETAIANAKLALEEAFTPRLQSMLSHKIAEEAEDELSDDEEVVDVPTENAGEEEETEVSTENAEEEGEEYNESEEEEDPTTESEEEETFASEEEEVADETADEADEDDLELESIIRELEDEDETEVTVENEDEDESEVTTEDEDEDEVAVATEEEEEVEDGELDLGEVIKALQEEEEEEVAADEKTDELEEAYSTIKYLKDKINEVNLLNAKLLFSNKLFRGNSLNESQKMKVIETFDRANSVREVKLVYSTLAESLKGYKPGKKRQVTEGFASKATNSTKPNKNVIVESNNFSSRMKKLAGLL